MNKPQGTKHESKCEGLSQNETANMVMSELS